VVQRLGAGHIQMLFPPTEEGFDVPAQLLHGHDVFSGVDIRKTQNAWANIQIQKDLPVGRPLIRVVIPLEMKCEWERLIIKLKLCFTA
jgi:hypothetical protein